MRKRRRGQVVESEPLPECGAVAFDDWIRHMVECGRTRHQWDVASAWNDPLHWSEEADPLGALALCTRAFERSSEWATGLTDHEIGEALECIVSPGESWHLGWLGEEIIPFEPRRRCLESMVPLFRDLFAVRCGVPYHVDKERGNNSLETICYMWWDVIPFMARPEWPEHQSVDTAAIQVMERILQLDSHACQESALHGLGHWRTDYPHLITPILRSYLDRRPSLPPGLREYAELATTGMVQ